MKSRDIKAPFADRFVAVSTPLHIDFKKVPGVEKRLPIGGKVTQDLLDEAKIARVKARDVLSKKLKDVGKPPKRSATTNQYLNLEVPQWQAMKTIADITPKKAWSPVFGEVAMTGYRASKPITRSFIQEEERKKRRGLFP